MKEITIYIFMQAQFGFCLLTPRTVKLCSKGTFLYTPDGGPDVCLPCTDEINYMHYHRHSNRACFPCSKVHDPETEFELTACNRTHDAEIKCKHTHYRSMPKHPDAKGECKKCSECVNPTLPCQDIHDTVCCPGPNSEAVLTKDGVYTCRELCQSGQYFNTSTDLCMTCPLGTYMTDANHTNTACKTCQLPNHNFHQIPIEACNSTHPAIFGCENGFFRNRLLEHHRGEVICLPCRHCQQYEARACDRYQDTVCCSQPYMIVVDTVDGHECRTEMTVNIDRVLSTLPEIRSKEGITNEMTIHIIYRPFITISSLLPSLIVIFIIAWSRETLRQTNGAGTIIRLNLVHKISVIINYHLTLMCLLLALAFSFYSNSFLWEVVIVAFFYTVVVSASFVRLSECKKYNGKDQKDVTIPLLPEKPRSLPSEKGNNQAIPNWPCTVRRESDTGVKLELNLLKRTMTDHERARMYADLQLEIEQGAYINSVDDAGKTLLMYAAEGGKIELLQWLINNDADLHSRDTSGNNALAFAAQNGYNNCVEELIIFYTLDDINISNNDGVTVLMMAVSSSSTYKNFPLLFINAGADVDRKDNSGDTALIYAVKKGRAEWVDIMLKTRAFKEVNHKNRTGFTAAMFAVSLNTDNIILKKLILCGANIKDKDRQYNTLLAMGAKSGNEKCLHTLLQKGLKPLVNTPNRKRLTPLMMAVSSDAETNSCAEILIHFEANIKIRDRDGNTALFYAVKSRKPEYVALLSTGETDVNMTNNEGKTSLHFAATSLQNNRECLALLLRAGANLTIKDKDGNTALDLARIAQNETNMSAIRDWMHGKSIVL